MFGRILGWLVAGIVALVVIYAWVDGGEEELRVVTLPVTPPVEPAR